MKSTARRGALAILAAAVLSSCLAVPGAQGAAGDPLFVFTPRPPQSGPSLPPPAGELSGPCGLAVDGDGNLYVSDYYHHAVDVFSPTPTYKTQVREVDPLDGPCGLAVDSAGKLYVNAFHRNVARYTPSVFPVTGGTTYGSPLTIDSQHPTGVAVDPATGTSYVDERDRIASYTSTGAHLQDIGLGNLGEGYGLAISQFPATAGRLYVPDVTTNTVKVYDPVTSTTVPVATITGPPGGFTSLADSAVAVDRLNGDIYVADRQSSAFSERPESTIQVFDSTGAYEGRLKYNVIDAAPLGLAVDNSFSGETQGRVYVTSGNTAGASVYAYPPGSAMTAAPLVPSAVRAMSAAGGAGSGSAESPASPPVAGASETIQKHDLRLSVNGEISPRRLPRRGIAPIAVSVGWRIATTDGSPPPKLKSLKIEINRAGRFDFTGLPTCPYAKIQPATTERALSNCGSALVGRGSFSALVALAGQESYVTSGQMLLFNGRQGKKPVLFGQIYSFRPFANSFVIVFSLAKVKRGTYGTSLRATLPASLLTWGSLTEIQMRLARRFAYRGKTRSFLSAGCPAPKGFRQAVFPLARTSFSFLGGTEQSLTLNRSCKARG